MVYCYGVKRTALKRKSGLRKKAKTPISKLQRQLWQLCRAIIIKRYGKHCYTCPVRGEELQGANCHVGHFIPSSVCSTELRYSLDNLRPQCFRCNIHLSGNWPAYERHLISDNGCTFVSELKRRNEATKGRKYDVLWYQARVAEYERYLL
jgi:hypothetical protein